MKKQQLLDLLDSLNMRPGRGLGQNFLLDGNMLDSIVRDAAVRPGETILEAGPGFGALTERLLNAGAEVYAVEYDHRIAEYLRKKIKNERFHLFEGDAARIDLNTVLPPDTPFRAIANLPYSISSVFIARLLEGKRIPDGMIFMLQKEMAQRLAATVGTGNYGALSVRAQLYYDVSLLRIVPPDVFYPPPEVDSAIASFVKKTEQPDDFSRKYLPGLVKTAFAQRRKQLGKVLSQTYTKERTLAALEALNIDPTIRPERLTVADFVKLAKELFS